jgi:proteasome lid subunit RPN8/RPN11
MKLFSTIINRVLGEKATPPPKTVEPTPTVNLEPAIAPEQSQNGNTVESIKQVEPIIQVEAEVSIDQTNQPVDSLESLAEGESTKPEESTKLKGLEASSESEVQAEQQQPQELQTEAIAPQEDDKEAVESHESEQTADAEAQDNGPSTTTVEPPQVAEEEQQAEPKPRIKILGEPSEADEEESDAVQPEPQRTGFFLESHFSRGASLFQCKDEERRHGDCDVFMLQSVYLEINKHLSEDKSREYGGLLLGIEVHASNNDTPSILITNSLRADHTDGNSVRLTFTMETWREFDRQTDFLRKLGMNLRRLGWYHSHPNHGIFLSSYDLNVCADFTRQTHVALVVDPIRNEGGFFVHGWSGYRPHSQQGFWELQDRQQESVVTWRNVHRVATRTDGQPISIPQQTSDGTLRSDDTKHFQPESGYEKDNWTAGGMEGGELAQDSPILRRAAFINDDDQPVIRLHNPIQDSDSSNMPPWIFLVVAVLLPTILAILALRSLSNLRQDILAMEQSLSTLTQNLSNLETKVREAAASRPVIEPSASQPQSSTTSGADAPAVTSGSRNRTNAASSTTASRNSRAQRGSGRRTNNSPPPGNKETEKKPEPAKGVSTPKPNPSN